MSERAPRRSTDEEAAPLLRDDDDDVGSTQEEEEPTLLERLNSIAQEPLTPLTQILLVVALVLLLLSAVFIGLFAGEYTKLKQREREDGPRPTVTVTQTAIVTTTAKPPGPTGSPAEEVCITPECIKLSASILSSLDVSKDPCENFFEFANGGWIASHPLPADKGSFGQFEALSIDNKRVVQHFLETPSATSSFTTSADEQLLHKLRSFYNSCLNENRLDEIGTEPLLRFVKTVKKLFRGEGFEISETSSEDDLSGLTPALAFLHSRGVPALFSFEIEGDAGIDPNFMVPWFDQASLGLPAKDYYAEPDIVSIYQNVIERLFKTLLDEEDKPPTPTLVENDAWPSWPWPPWDPDDEPDKDKTNNTEKARQLAEDVVAFETKLANVTLDADAYQDPFFTYNRVPLQNLTESLPQVSFPDYFATFAPRTFPENIIVTYPAYPVAVSELLSSTSNDTIEAYLVARAALALSPNLGMSTEAWAAQRSLLETLTGIKKGAVGDRAEYCVGKVESTLGFAAGRYFVNATFGGDSREKGTKIIEDIVKAFKASLPNVPWLDKESADAAAGKADAIRIKVGYPISPNTRDPSSILRYYSTVKIDQDTYFDNILNAAGSDMFKMWLKVGQRRNEDEWLMWPSMVNAYFNPPSNEIVFPAGILQPPFFSHDWPLYLSYGAFGQVAAHELTHAFDSAGRLYNQDGKLSKSASKPNIPASFFALGRWPCPDHCSADYTVDDGKGGVIHVNGNLTSGENIGDSGLIQAYRAWKAQFDESKKAGNEYLLPGLNYTREQLFFLAFGRIWGNNMKTAALVQRVRTDPHSPNIFRVEGTLSNIPEFAAAFKCPKGSKLNPPDEQRCLFWS
ncbi:Endothelin-converting enzyme 1 [Mycena indigotica]|uniref:Endothelin-converting enzyme 1 n=1 Tax=Mycena indigotica TaxID=2126181 RepID=A0A8H6VYV9_9AGAR|nr:Endothelin-converting enzyme 1 [Mycena indigotica]KAF7295323.1 Endothelin-converting enzyme 1 [Mycena indigotica]